MQTYYIGIDIGATWLRLGLADKHGKIIHRIKYRTPADPEELITTLIDNIRKIVHNREQKLNSIGIGSIGPIDIKTGRIMNTPNIDLGVVEVAKPIHDEFNKPVYMVNDCSAGVLGEKYFGAGKNLKNIVYVTLSSGIGGGAIVDNHLLFGKDGNAVEIGHLIVDPSERLRCGCGGYGHWEAYASGKNIPNFVRLLVRSGVLGDFERSFINNLINRNLENLRTEHVFEAAKNGDEVALRIINEIGKINSVGLANIINAFDPELITIGGGIALNNPELILAPITKNLPRLVINRQPEIKITQLGEDIVLIGAIAVAMHPDHIPEEFRRFE